MENKPCLLLQFLFLLRFQKLLRNGQKVTGVFPGQCFLGERLGALVPPEALGKPEAQCRHPSFLCEVYRGDVGVSVAVLAFSRVNEGGFGW